MLRVLKPLGAAPVVMGMVLAGFTGIARVDAQANPGGHDFGGQQPPVAPPPQMVQPPVANMGGNAAGQQGGNAQSDFPAADPLRDWVLASARTARTRAMFHLAEKQLSDSIRDAQWTFEGSREYKDAVAAEKQAYDAFTAERQRALKSVVNDPKYRAAIDLRDEMESRLAKVRAMARPNPVPREDLLAMASAKLQYASTAHNMERDALEKDSAVQDARQKMVQASSRANDLRNAFDLSIRTNAQIVQARHNLDQSRVDLITAEAYYNAATIAGAVATDFSYYRHRWDGLAGPGLVGWGPYGYSGF
ncbi:MAG TPA: hypothetical protein VGI81_25570 [Tepidisphaeraceae bacterium]|jgi:hypothetical protein